jgi:hypothetical protein
MPTFFDLNRGNFKPPGMPQTPYASGLSPYVGFKLVAARAADNH